MIDIEIDGQAVSIKEGSMIIEAADQRGIYIPRFCYHKKLSIAANCRMCLVEVEKVNKPLPACATPITPNMKVLTRSKMVLDAQRAVMEYLLINHPLDCPICDQGGECELQDLTMGYGFDHSDYQQSKRAVVDEDLGPLIDTCMTRCIQCTRCVRFGEEIAGMRELGATGRGEKMRIGTYVKHMLQSELSGNIIDLCPVGALTSKPYRYSARAWELRETPLISPHDCVGSNIFVHSRGQEYVPQREIMRVVPRENEAINETWISDRDRFSYLALNHPDRITSPKIKRQGQWQELSWAEALVEVVERLQSISEQHSSEDIAALVSPNASVEECYVLQKWVRAFGSPHIDHRLRLQDFSDQHHLAEFPSLGMPIAAIADLKAIVLIGSSIRFEQPLLAHRVHQAFRRGAHITVINPVDDAYPFMPHEKIISADVVHALAQIAAALAEQAGQKHSISALRELEPDENSRRIAQQLTQAATSSAIFMGDYALNHPQAALIRSLIQCIAHYTQATVGVLTEGANSAGAWLAGAVPHRGPAGQNLAPVGSDAHTLLTSKKKRAYLLLGVELEYDCAYSSAALSALMQSECVVCLHAFTTPQMLDYADIILPIAPFTEMDGTFVNVVGDWQSFTAATLPLGEAKPAWKIIATLAQLMQLPGFVYEQVSAISAELKQHLHNRDTRAATSNPLPQTLPAPLQNELLRFAPWPMYRVDALCRRSLALQQTISVDVASIAVHPDVVTALQLNVGADVIARQGEQQLRLPLSINKNLAPGTVLIPSGLEETAGFGVAQAPVNLERVIA